jgi:ubiquinol-cytochrome c reductase cytochrome c1 subunit
MKSLLVSFLLGAIILGAATAQGAGPSIPLDSVKVDVTDQASLQRGARLFVNYCMGCHSAEYMRYTRVGRDLGLTENQLLASMIFTTDDEGELVNPGSLMTNAMTKPYGEEAFGKAPPDLTLLTRVRSEEWLYTFLRSFYLDDSPSVGREQPAVRECRHAPSALGAARLAGEARGRERFRPAPGRGARQHERSGV